MKNFAYGSIVGAVLCNIVHLVDKGSSPLYGFGTVITGAICAIIVTFVEE